MEHPHQKKNRFDSQVAPAEQEGGPHNEAVANTEARANSAHNFFPKQQTASRQVSLNTKFIIYPNG